MLDELTDERRYNRLAGLVGRARVLPLASQLEFILAECADDASLASEAYEILCEETGPKFGKPLVSLRSDLQPGDILGGRYIITGVLGGGAQGRVYEAEDRRLGKRLAVKQMLGSDGVSRKLFEREARLLGHLRSVAPAHVAGSLPNVTDFVSDLNSLFIVMEQVPGATLAELIAAHGRRYSLADVVEWGDRLLEVLEFLHGRRPDPVIHRDVKPANLKLTPDGQLVLLDFGLTKGEIAEVSRLGRGGTSVVAYGTAQYAPWEQVKDGRTDERGDLFSAGATLYRLLTATDFPNAFERKEALADGQPDPLRPACELNHAVSEGLAQVLGRAMSLKASERYASAADMRRAWLRAADLDEVTVARGRDCGSDADTPLPAVSTAGRTSSLLRESKGGLRAWASGITTALNIVMLPALVLLLCLWIVAAPLYALVLFPVVILSVVFSVAAVKNRLPVRRVVVLKGVRSLLLFFLVFTGYMPLSQSIERLVSRVSPPIAYKLLDPFNAHVTLLLRRTLGPAVERLVTDRASAATALLFGTFLLMMLTASEVWLSARRNSSQARLWKALFIEPWESVRRLAGGRGSRG